MVEGLFMKLATATAKVFEGVRIVQASVMMVLDAEFYDEHKYSVQGF